MILTGKALFIYKMKKIYNFVLMILMSSVFVGLFFMMALIG